MPFCVPSRKGAGRGGGAVKGPCFTGKQGIILMEKTANFVSRKGIVNCTYVLRFALHSSTVGFHSLLFSPRFFVSSGDLISGSRLSKPICVTREEIRRRKNY